MTRGICWSFVGFLVLVAMAGCARQAWFGEREPWRREAEVACLKSGAVREGPAVAILKPIQGPGMCGAEYPLKVSVLGEPPIVGYADEVVRPVGAIPQHSYPPPSVTPVNTPTPHYEPDRFYTPTPDTYPRNAGPGPSTSAPGAPLSLAPPGVERPVASSPYPPSPSYGAPYAPTPLLGPPRGLPMTGSIGRTTVSPPATLACPIVSALDRWITESVQQAALRWYRQPVVEIKQISAYSCRGMNGDSSAHISEHAFGNALDIAAFTFADGRRVTVRDGWHGLPEEQGFLRDVQGAACQHFATVLAPGANVYHYDHIHVDLMRRTSGRRICEPAPISGEAAAARARYATRRPGDRGITGSITPPDDADDPRPRAIPGAD